jgi:hypothetical protein
MALAEQDADADAAGETLVEQAERAYGHYSRANAAVDIAHVAFGQAAACGPEEVRPFTDALTGTLGEPWEDPAAGAKLLLVPWDDGYRAWVQPHAGADWSCADGPDALAVLDRARAVLAAQA